MLHINDLTYRIGARLLIDHATVALPDGAKVGLVGRNGAGKTTLFRLIAGEIAPEGGSIALPRNTRIGQVAQEAPAGPETLIDVVLAADHERAALLAEAESAHDPHRIAEIHTRLADIDAHSAEARAARDPRRPRLRRGGAAAARARRSPAAGACAWRSPRCSSPSPTSCSSTSRPTISTSRARSGSRTTSRAIRARVLIISHDRDLLNRAVDTIVHLDQRQAHPLSRRLRLLRPRSGASGRRCSSSSKKKQDDQRRHMQAFVDRFRYKASKARQAQSRLKTLAQAASRSRRSPTRSVFPFRFPEPAKQLAPPIIAMEDVSVGYEPGTPVLSGLDLRIDDDDRIGLLGANGNGKSTFAKLIAGRLAAVGGQLRRAATLAGRLFRPAPARRAQPGAVAPTTMSAS